MKVGDQVKYAPNGRIGTCLGPVLHFKVWWVKIKWDDGSDALVLEHYLEVLSESK